MGGVIASHGGGGVNDGIGARQQRGQRRARIRRAQIQRMERHPSVFGKGRGFGRIAPQSDDLMPRRARRAHRRRADKSCRAGDQHCAYFAHDSGSIGSNVVCGV